MHVRSRGGENLEITSKGYLFLFKVGSESNKHFLLEHALKKEYADAHKQGYLHLHDLDFSLVYEYEKVGFKD